MPSTARVTANRGEGATLDHKPDEYCDKRVERHEVASPGSGGKPYGRVGSYECYDQKRDHLLLIHKQPPRLAFGECDQDRRPWQKARECFKREGDCMFEHSAQTDSVTGEAGPDRDDGRPIG